MGKKKMGPKAKKKSVSKVNKDNQRKDVAPKSDSGFVNRADVELAKLTKGGN